MSVGRLGQTLNAAYVLTGSVRPAAGQLHFVFELTRTQTAAVSWSGTFDRPRERFLDVQGEVAQAVAGKIVGSLRPNERQSLVASPTRSDEAFMFVARGTAYLARRLVTRAMVEFRQAVAVDSLSALPWARLAQAYARCVFRGCIANSDTLRARAAAAADRALALDSSLADAWLGRGLAQAASPLNSDVARSYIAVRRAATLDPRNAEVLHTLGTALEGRGEDAEAALHYRSALSIDPGRAVTWSHLAGLAWAQGRFADAQALADTALTFQSDFSDAKYQRWRATLARRIASEMRGLSRRLYGADTTAMSREEKYRPTIEDAYGAMANGDTALASRLADELKVARVRSIFVALLDVRLGRRADASDIIRGWGEPGITTWMGLRSPAYADLRVIPEFEQYVSRARAIAMGESLPRATNPSP